MYYITIHLAVNKQTYDTYNNNKESTQV